MSAGVYGSLLAVGTRPLATTHGRFDLHVFQNLQTRALVLVATRGEVRAPEPLLLRVHSSCVTSEAYGSRDCDCAEQLDGALAAIDRAGRGAVVYLEQEGRGAGFAAKARDRMLVQASANALTTFEAYARLGLAEDDRRYDEVRFACRLLDIAAPLRVLTNNPDKVAALAAQGLAVAGTCPLTHAPSPFSVDYLAAKSRAGHALADASGVVAAAALPEPVAAIDPAPLPHAPGLVRLASYLMPVAPRDREDRAPRWLRLHAYFDLGAQRDRVLLTHGRPGAGVSLVRVQPEPMLERFQYGGGPAMRRWHAVVDAFVRHGSGVAVMVPFGPLTCGATRPPAHEGDAAGLDLLAHHVASGRARAVVTDAEEAAAAAGLARALRARGVALEAPLVLPTP